MTVWMSMQNCGDGSTYPLFVESKELAVLDQEHMDEGWGETCVDSITIESESPITIKDEITTAQMMLDEINDDYDVDDKYRPNEKVAALEKLIERQ